MVGNKLKEIDIKRYTCYYWNDVININDLNFENILFIKNYMTILLFIILYIKSHIL